MIVLRFFYHLLERILIVLCVFIGSQGPAFMQQYTQRLAGHANEAAYQVQNLKKFAEENGKSLNEYIAKFLANGDADFVLQGKYMEGLVERAYSLNASFFKLESSSLWWRPIVFVQEFDSSIGEQTYLSFQPALNLTIEGLLYGLSGLLTGYLLCQCLAFFFFRFNNWCSGSKYKIANSIANSLEK